jgi:hypothetical protein
MTAGTDMTGTDMTGTAAAVLIAVLIAAMTAGTAAMAAVLIAAMTDVLIAAGTAVLIAALSRTAARTAAMSGTGAMTAAAVLQLLANAGDILERHAVVRGYEVTPLRPPLQKTAWTSTTTHYITQQIRQMMSAASADLHAVLPLIQTHPIKTLK